MDGLEICFGVSVGVEMGRETNLKGQLVEGERQITDGLNVSNNSAENIVSQGRFECFAYNIRNLVTFKDESIKLITMSTSRRTLPFDKVAIITWFLRANRPCTVSGQPNYIVKI